MFDECLYGNERIPLAEMDGPDASGKGRIRREIEPDPSGMALWAQSTALVWFTSPALTVMGSTAA